MMQIGNQGPENIAGILKFIRTHFVLKETRVKIPDFSQVFIQLHPHASYFQTPVWSQGQGPGGWITAGPDESHRRNEYSLNL